MLPCPNFLSFLLKMPTCNLKVYKFHCRSKLWIVLPWVLNANKLLTSITQNFLGWWDYCYTTLYCYGEGNRLLRAELIHGNTPENLSLFLFLSSITTVNCNSFWILLRYLCSTNESCQHAVTQLLTTTGCGSWSWEDLCGLKNGQS